MLFELYSIYSIAVESINEFVNPEQIPRKPKRLNDPKFRSMHRPLPVHGKVLTRTIHPEDNKPVVHAPIVGCEIVGL